MVNIIYNGKAKKIPVSGYTLETLLKEEGHKRDLIIIKINGRIVSFEDHKSKDLKKGDIVEVEHVLLSGG